MDIRAELSDNAFNKTMEWLGRPYNMVEMEEDEALRREFNKKLYENLQEEFKKRGLEYHSKLMSLDI